MTFKSSLKSAGAAAVLCGLLAAPAFAQMANSNSANGNGTMGTNTAMPNNPGTIPNSSASNADHSGPSGTLEKTHGMWRAGAVNGADVYDSAGKQIGTIDNLLINSSGKVTDAVISVGGIAGVGGKLVEVPFSKLQFKPSDNGNGGNMQASSGSGSPTDYSIVFPDQSEQSLKAMPTFSYDNG